MKKAHFGTTVAEVAGKIDKRKYAFIFCMIVVFFILFSLLSALDIVPEPTKLSDSGKKGTALAETVINPAVNEEPVRIIASTIGLDAAIENPSSRNNEVLDEALLSGAVRYPGSSKMTDDGTMFLFGHSSNLPIVHNQNYKVFNNIKNLKTGDLVSVKAATTENVYRVVSVSQAPADEIKVELTGHGKRLVLSTCNSFGGKDSRYVVDAEFVGSYPLSNNP